MSQPADDGSITNPLHYKNRSANAARKLLKSRGENSPAAFSPSEPLAELAAKRGQDSLKFTQFFLKNRLVHDLDKTMAKQFEAYPELKDKVYVGVIVDEGFSAEVIPLEKAAQAVEGVASEEALEQMRKAPVGYFQRQDFTLRTPPDEALQSFKKGLQEFFQRNSDVIDYLRNHPEAHVDAEDLYSPPST